MSLLMFVGRWAWLGLIVMSLVLGFYLFRTLSEFEDSAQLTTDVAELRGFQEELLQIQILSLLLGVETSGSPDQILAEADRTALELIERIDSRDHRCVGCDSSAHRASYSHLSAVSIQAVIRDLHALGTISTEDSADILAAIGADPALALALAGDEVASAFDPSNAEFEDVEIALLAARYAALSASVTRNLDHAMNALGKEGEAAASQVQQVGRLGIATLLVGGVLSTSGFAWAGRRARRLTWDVEQARQLDALKSEFVGLASHELRTPLAGIYGFSELLLSEEQLPPHARDWAARINEESGRLAAIVEDLLDISQIEAGAAELELEPVDVADVVDSVVRLYEDSPNHRIVWAGLRDARVAADRARLIQVFSNIVDNAIKYSPSGGTVRIDGDVDANEVRLRVIDDGLGIPTDQLPLIFERFHRGQRPEPQNIRSTGLGLYLVRELLTLMNGTVTAESELNAGTTLTVRLPRLLSADRLNAATA